MKIHVLLDWVGSEKMDEELLALMREAGVEVQKYHPIKWYTLGKLNNRTHRGLLVVDGRIGFTGGVGIADQWTGNVQDPEHWRDTHFRLVGPAVAQMQSAFVSNWTKVTGRVLHTAEYFPASESAGPQPAGVSKLDRRRGREHADVIRDRTFDDYGPAYRYGVSDAVERAVPGDSDRDGK